MTYLLAYLINFLFPAITLITGLACVMHLIRHFKAKRNPKLDEDSQSSISYFTSVSLTAFPILLVISVIKSSFYEPSQIPSESMLPTLQIGDHILIDKSAYNLNIPFTTISISTADSPQRGDVVIFHPPKNPSIYYIKRIVGIAGDSISYNEHALTINGSPVSRTHLSVKNMGNETINIEIEDLGKISYLTYKNTPAGKLSLSGNWVVPEGYYFVMGDNRDHSDDSREWGFVKLDAIVGKATYVWMNWGPLPSFPSFEQTRPIK